MAQVSYFIICFARIFRRQSFKMIRAFAVKIFYFLSLSRQSFHIDEAAFTLVSAIDALGEMRCFLAFRHAFPAYAALLFIAFQLFMLFIAIEAQTYSLIYANIFYLLPYLFISLARYFYIYNRAPLYRFDYLTQRFVGNRDEEFHSNFKPRRYYFIIYIGSALLSKISMPNCFNFDDYRFAQVRRFEILRHFD